MEEKNVNLHRSGCDDCVYRKAVDERCSHCIALWRLKRYEFWARLLPIVGLVVAGFCLSLWLASCARTTTLHVKGAQIDSLHYQQEVVIRNK